MRGYRGPRRANKATGEAADPTSHQLHTGDLTSRQLHRWERSTDGYLRITAARKI